MLPYDWVLSFKCAVPGKMAFNEDFDVEAPLLLCLVASQSSAKWPGPEHLMHNFRSFASLTQADLFCTSSLRTIPPPLAMF
jgi:hypothetical protein